VPGGRGEDAVGRKTGGKTSRRADRGDGGADRAGNGGRDPGRDCGSDRDADCPENHENGEGEEDMGDHHLRRGSGLRCPHDEASPRRSPGPVDRPPLVDNSATRTGNSAPHRARPGHVHTRAADSRSRRPATGRRSATGCCPRPAVGPPPAAVPDRLLSPTGRTARPDPVPHAGGPATTPTAGRTPGPSRRGPSCTGTPAPCCPAGRPPRRTAPRAAGPHWPRTPSAPPRARRPHRSRRPRRGR
jgi:hypothetical protein